MGRRVLFFLALMSIASTSLFADNNSPDVLQELSDVITNFYNTSSGLLKSWKWIFSFILLGVTITSVLYTYHVIRLKSEQQSIYHSHGINDLEKYYNLVGVAIIALTASYIVVGVFVMVFAGGNQGDISFQDGWKCLVQDIIAPMLDDGGTVKQCPIVSP